MLRNRKRGTRALTVVSQDQQPAEPPAHWLPQHMERERGRQLQRVLHLLHQRVDARLELCAVVLLLAQLAEVEQDAPPLLFEHGHLLVGEQQR